MIALPLKIPPPVYLLLFAGGMWVTHIYFPLALIVPAHWNRLGIGLMVVALLLDLWALSLFLRARTTPNPFTPERTQVLVTSGLYRFTRNPMYLGLLIFLIGWGIYLGKLAPFIWLPVFVWVLNVQQIIPEEKMLAEKFGDAYRAYQNRVPRWI